MDITIIDNPSDKAEMDKVLDAHYMYIAGKLSCEEWYDSDRYPRKQWLHFDGSEEAARAGEQFVVVDNRDGDCFVEAFKTLDGALLYLCDVHMTTEGQDEWDRVGAVSGNGGFVRDCRPEEEET